MKYILPAISQSSMSDYVRCKMIYYYREVEGIRPKRRYLPDSIKAGALWDLYLQGKLTEEAIESYGISSHLLAKLTALTQAYEELKFNVPKSQLLGQQFRVQFPIADDLVVGFVDVAYEDHLVESKLSSRPEFYCNLKTIEIQAGTYLLGNEAWEFVDVQAVRLPELRTGFGKYSDESSEAYQNRIFGDILSRPSFYFIGFDREHRTFGKRFWRSEFDLGEILRIYKWVLVEIEETIKRDSWYPNKLACHVPATCLFHPICKSGVISKEIFESRTKGGDDK